MLSTSAIQEWLQTSRISGNLGQLLADLALLVQERMGGSSGAVCECISGSNTWFIKPMLELISYSKNLDIFVMKRPLIFFFTVILPLFVCGCPSSQTKLWWCGLGKGIACWHRGHEEVSVVAEHIEAELFSFILWYSLYKMC